MQFIDSGKRFFFRLCEDATKPEIYKMISCKYLISNTIQLFQRVFLLAPTMVAQINHCPCNKRVFIAIGILVSTCLAYT